MLNHAGSSIIGALRNMVPMGISAGKTSPIGPSCLPDWNATKPMIINARPHVTGDICQATDPASNMLFIESSRSLWSTYASTTASEEASMVASASFYDTEYSATAVSFNHVAGQGETRGPKHSYVPIGESCHATHASVVPRDLHGGD